VKSIKLSVFTVCLLAGSVAHAGWFRTYGGSGISRGSCVQEIEDGYMVVGRQMLSSGKTALWLLKTDTLGNIRWSKTYSATDTTDAWGNFVQQTSDGGYIITGVDWRGFSQIWLLKTDSNGDTLWTRNYGRSQGLCVQEIPDEGYILTGKREWNNPRAFLLKTNLLGDSIWMKTYLISPWSFSRGLFVQQTRDSGYIITGTVGDTVYQSNTEAVSVIKTDKNGDTLWSFFCGGEDLNMSDVGQCVRQTKDSCYIVAGMLKQRAFLSKFDDQGDTVWFRAYGFNEASCCIEKNDKQEYVVTGDADKFVTLSAGNTSWLLSTNGNGDSVWARTYDAVANYYVQETRDKGFIITGSNGILFLLKTDSLGLLGIVENPIVESDYGWNVPHPIGSYIVLHYQGLPQGFRANVFDVTGRKVDQIRGDGIEGAMTWGINYPSGVYFIQALDNRNLQKTVKVVLVR
jgi:hypothetical protein